MLIARAVLLVCAAALGLAEKDGDEDFTDLLDERSPNISSDTSSGTEETVEGKPGDLVQISIVTRHGQRTPKNPYPNDPWRDRNYWPEGWLQLTEVGAEQHRSLGRWLRERYPDFIPKRYRTGDVYVRSTGISRTLASAFALMSALFPGQAIPVHSSESRCDNLFSPHKNCPAFDREMERFMSTQEVEEKNRKPFYNMLSSNMGRKVNSLASAESLYSLLTIEQQRGYEIPSWTREIYPQPLKNLTGKYLSRSSASPLLARLRYGSLLKDILHNAKYGGREDKTEKLRVYSAHDFTVVGLLNCLGLFDGAPPGFASSITFEVRRGAEPDRNSIEIYYRSDSFAEPNKIAVEPCGTPCYVETLRQILDSVIPVDIQKECGSKVKPLLYSVRTAEDVSVLWAIGLASAALGAMLIVCCTKIFVCRRHQPHILYNDNEPSKRNYSTLKGTNYTERV